MTFSGRLAGCGELPQYVVQNPAVLVVVEFLRGIDAQARLELRGGAVIGSGNDPDRLLRAAVESGDFKSLLAAQTQGLRVMAPLVLQRQHAHADQVGAVDALEALGD